MNSLNQLFQEILHSEQTFNNRLNYQKELNGQIESLQRDLMRAKDKTLSLEGQRIVKMQSLVDCEVEQKMIEIKKETLDEKNKELESEIKDLENELDKLTKTIEKERDEFQAELSEFNGNYDLKGSGIKYQELQTQKQVKLLQEETRLLEEKCLHLESRKEELLKAEKKLVEEEKPLQILLRTMAIVKDEHNRLTSQKTSLEKEKYSLTEGLDEDPELKKHVQELESCHNSSSERLYHQLREELETLQQECYTRQMKYGHQQQDKAVASSTKPSWSHVKPSSFHSKNDVAVKYKTQLQQQRPVIDLTRENEEEEKGESENESDWEPLDESELASIDIMEAIYSMEEQEREGQEKLLDPFDDDFEESNFDSLPALLPPPTLRQNASSLAAKNLAINHQTSLSLASSISKSFSSSSMSNAKVLGSQGREGLLKNKAKKVKFHY